MIRAIIIDDEQDARDGLNLLVEKFCPGVTIIATCESPEIGIEKILELQPNLVFLDIQMPQLSGFDLLEKIETIYFEVIFVTAFDKYAIKAIKFSALDYLLKPVEVDQLVSAVQRVKEKQHSKSSNFKSLLNNVKQNAQKLERLAIPSDNEIILQKVSDIIYCEADSNYTVLHLADDKKITVSKTLKEFENILPEIDFCRIHHSTLVNLNHVVKYVKGEGGYVLVTGRRHLDVSRRKKDTFIQALNKL
ncbi:LytR/AlgR family response regulator transcription factor [Winogradskyella sp. R77965]|uniref:LytR/AlgR family response regulator transcription factor n=1 Tax=Winogradskyella sp. R77965 TaxID=3093872 RepID=UPI0037DCE610